MKITWTESKRAKLAEMMQQGLPYWKAAEFFGISEVAARHAAKRFGTIREVPLRGQRRRGSRWSTAECDLLQERVAAGDSWVEIGRALGISGIRVREKAEQLGLSKRPQKGGHPRGADRGKIGRYVTVRPTGEDLTLLTNADRRGRLVLEHRLVMARTLGRPLGRGESVHHINGNASDNRPENLQLRQGSHGQGVALQCLDCGSHNVHPVSLKENSNYEKHFLRE